MKTAAIIATISIFILSVNAALGADIYSRTAENAVIKTNPENDTVTFLKALKFSTAMEQDAAYKKLLASSKFAEAAIYFLNNYKSIFKLVDPEKELVVDAVQHDKLNFTHVRLRQVYSGIPVWGSQIIVHINAENRIYLVNGRYIPTPANIHSRPVLTLSDTKQLIFKAFPDLHGDCGDCRIRLVIFNPPGSYPRLAYQADIRESLMATWQILIDARTEEILKKISTTIPSKEN